MNNLNLPTELQKYEEQIQHLLVFIKTRGLVFETEEDMKNIMTLWINEGAKFMQRIEQMTNQDGNFIDMMYKRVCK